MQINAGIFSVDIILVIITTFFTRYFNFFFVISTEPFGEWRDLLYFY
ncbi:MAG: hypothetical protein WCT18_05085 [Patescibacteria group bacterium]